MADRLSKGRLAAILLEHEALGYSADQSARELYADHRIEATRATVLAWREMAHAATASDEAAS